jgi:hypothetical protein
MLVLGTVAVWGLGYDGQPWNARYEGLCFLTLGIFTELGCSLSVCLVNLLVK